MSDLPTSPTPDDPHPALRTRLTSEYGIRQPFVGAGMAFVAHEHLAAAVTNAGGYGVLGASPDPADSLVVMVQRLRALS
jgi:NAD(P)H-dependent flavin oxidoreductase YrpB (nitropropane dioxygenase family)